MTKANQPDNKLLFFHSPNLAMMPMFLYIVFFSSSQSPLEWMNVRERKFVRFEIIDTTLNCYLVNLRYKQWPIENQNRCRLLMSSLFSQNKFDVYQIVFNLKNNWLQAQIPHCLSILMNLYSQMFKTFTHFGW